VVAAAAVLVLALVVVVVVVVVVVDAKVMNTQKAQDTVSTLWLCDNPITTQNPSACSKQGNNNMH
jgi:hypothetical protein